MTLPLSATTESNGGSCFFYLAGVDDYESDPRYASALDGREENVATVLLAHEPVQVFGGFAVSFTGWVSSALLSVALYCIHAILLSPAFVSLRGSSLCRTPMMMCSEAGIIERPSPKLGLE